MESDNFTRHYIIRYLSARELVLPPLIPKNNPIVRMATKSSLTSSWHHVTRLIRSLPISHYMMLEAQVELCIQLEQYEQAARKAAT